MFNPTAPGHAVNGPHFEGVANTPMPKNGPVMRMAHSRPSLLAQKFEAKGPLPQSSNRDVWLNILKFIPADSILNDVCRVSKHFYNLSRYALEYSESVASSVREMTPQAREALSEKMVRAQENLLKTEDEQSGSSEATVDAKYFNSMLFAELMREGAGKEQRDLLDLRYTTDRNSGRTLLERCASHPDISVADLMFALYEPGINVNAGENLMPPPAQDHFGGRSLAVVIKKNATTHPLEGILGRYGSDQLRKMKALLAHPQMNPNPMTSDFEPIIHKIISGIENDSLEDGMELLQWLIDDQRIDLNATNLDGDTILHVAAGVRRNCGVEPSVLRFLLDHPRTRELINHTNFNGNTPLFVKVAERNVVAVKMLLDHGADASASNKFGVSIRQQAIWNAEPYETDSDSENEFEDAENRAGADRRHMYLDMEYVRAVRIKEMLEAHLSARQNVQGNGGAVSTAPQLDPHMSSGTKEDENL